MPAPALTVFPIAGPPAWRLSSTELHRDIPLTERPAQVPAGHTRTRNWQKSPTSRDGIAHAFFPRSGLAPVEEACNRVAMGNGERRVLVIDDDTTVRRMLGELLLCLGYAPDLAPDGQEGLALFAGGDYAVVVTDVRMPGVSGWQVASTVRRLRPQVGVVVITGSITALHPPEDDLLHVDNLVVLPKPFGLPELRTALARVLAA